MLTKSDILEAGFVSAEESLGQDAPIASADGSAYATPTLEADRGPLQGLECRRLPPQPLLPIQLRNPYRRRRLGPCHGFLLFARLLLSEK